MLRCPTCLNRVDGGEKRCSACGARLRSRRTAEALTDDGIATRPRVLVERELQARIEAQTATGFRQRWRAMKAARRIASLPASLFEAGLMIEPENGSWSPLPNTPPTVIDLPATAIHDVRTPPRRVPAEPLALVAPVIDISVPAVEPVGDASEPEPVPAPDPQRRRRLAARFEARWALWKASRATEDETPDAFLADGVVDLPPPPATVFEPVAPDPVSEPQVAPPRPAERVKAAPAAPVTETVAQAARGAADWQPSTSLWANRVFNSRAKPVEVASWPPKRKPVPPADLVSDDIDAEVRESARVD